MKRIAFTLALAALAGCATVQLRTADPRRAIVLAPYERTIAPFGSVVVPEGTVLYPSLLDGRDAWCSTVPVYYAPGDARPMCFMQEAPGVTEGWLREGYVARTASGFRYDVDVPYRVQMAPALPPRR